MIRSLVPTALRRTAVRLVSAREVLDTAVASPTKLSLPDDTRRHPPAVRKDDSKACPADICGGMAVPHAERQSRPEKGQDEQESYDSALVMIDAAGTEICGRAVRQSRLSARRPGRG